MKKTIYDFILLCMSMLTCVIMGCGSKNETNNNFTYTAQHSEVQYECNYIQDVVFFDGKFYIMGASLNEESIQKSLIYCHNTTDDTDTEFDIPLKDHESMTKFLINNDGNLSIIIIGVSADEEPVINQCSIMEISLKDGSILSKTDITDQIGIMEDKYITEFIMDSKGNYYLGSGSKNILILNSDLTVKAHIPVDGYIKMMGTSLEGPVYTIAIINQRLKFFQVDLEQQALVLPEKCNEVIGDMQIYPSKNASFLLGDSTAISEFNLNTGSKSELFQWMIADIDYEKIACLEEDDEGNFWIACKNEELYDEKTPVEFVKLSKTNALDVEEKENIYYGTLYLDDIVKNAIIDFNKSNEKYRIIAIDYGKDGIDDGRTKLNADLIIDKCPDLIDLASVNYAKYVKKGLFENLDSYMEKSNIEKNDYVENVFSSYEYKGNQYGIIPQFNINTLVVKSSKIGNCTGWDTDEMIDFAHESGCKNVFYNEDRRSILKYCVAYNMDEFIDSESGKCSFDTDKFKKVLEFAAEFPEESIREQDENIATLLQSDKSLLMNLSINSSFTNQLLEKVYGEDISFIGYPNKDRKGNKVRAGFGCCAISSKSSHKDGAWEFLEFLISDKVQNQIAESMQHTGFPVKKTELENFLTKELEPLGDNMEITGDFDGYPYQLGASTPEDVKKVKELIESASGLAGSFDEDIINIILDEAEPFYNGSRSVDDTVKVIQNRAQTCVNENR